MAEVLKTILYLFGGVLVFPGALLAYFIWTVHGAAEQKNLLGLILFIFERFIDLLAWCFWFIIPSLVAWLVLAFFAKYRVCGAAPMALLAVASLIEMFATTGAPKASGDLFFPFLSLAGLLINLWIIWDWASPSLAAK